MVQDDMNRREEKFLKEQKNLQNLQERLTQQGKDLEEQQYKLDEEKVELDQIKEVMRSRASSRGVGEDHDDLQSASPLMHRGSPTVEAAVQVVSESDDTDSQKEIGKWGGYIVIGVGLCEFMDI